MKIKTIWKLNTSLSLVALSWLAIRRGVIRLVAVLAANEYERAGYDSNNRFKTGNILYTNVALSTYST